MSTSDPTTAIVLDVLRRNVDEDDLSVEGDNIALDFANLDSVKRVEIILQIEEECGISLSSKEIDAVEDFDGLLKLVRTKRSA